MTLGQGTMFQIDPDYTNHKMIDMFICIKNYFYLPKVTITRAKQKLQDDKTYL